MCQRPDIVLRHLYNIGNADTVGSCPSITRVTISTTLHCLLERVFSRDWSRKSCHNFRDLGGQRRKNSGDCSVATAS
jgi:hypothetical protein